MSESQPSGFDFTTVLMSSVHDIKNSLLLFQNTLDVLTDRLEKDDTEGQTGISQLQYEIQRINNSLIQILSIYKLDQHMLQLQYEPHNVSEFLNDQILQNSATCRYLTVVIDVDCESELVWQFDKNLLSGIIGTILNNALRYSKNRITLAAIIDDHYLCLHVDDDGDGFPENMLECQGEINANPELMSGSTGLGIFFATRIAELHEHEGLNGDVQLANNSRHGGGRFTIRIPGQLQQNLAELFSSSF